MKRQPLLVAALLLAAAGPAGALPGAEAAFYGNDLAGLERLATGSKDPDAQAWLARALYRQGRFASARQALAKAGDGLEAELARGDYALYLADGDGAEPHFRKAAALEPANAHAAWGLAYALINRDRFDEAVEAAEKAVALAKTPADRSRAYATLGGAQGLKANLGSLVDKLRFGPQVKASLTKAVALDPRNGGARYALGRFYVVAPGAIGGDPAKALDPLRKALALDPYYFNTHLWYLKALGATGRKADYQAEAADYKTRFKDLPEALAALARIDALK